MPNVLYVLELIASVLKIAISRPRNLFMNLETKSFKFCLVAGEGKGDSKTDSINKCVSIGVVAAIAAIAAVSTSLQ